MAKTAVLPCTCPNKFQDETYGKGQRVHNEAKGTGTTPKYRCTSCAKEK